MSNKHTATYTFIRDNLPRVWECIDSADAFEANQMKCRVKREMLNSDISSMELSTTELSEFQDMLIASFKCFGWI